MPLECRIINGDQAVILSRTTAIEALVAMRKCEARGDYARLFADDASFIRTAMCELEKAASDKAKNSTG